MKIYEFKKNIYEKVIIEFSEYKGRELIDIRVYYKASENENDWRPTTKGITLSRDKTPKLKEGVDKAFEEWEKEKS